jgi:hypothetical protein
MAPRSTPVFAAFTCIALAAGCGGGDDVTASDYVAAVTTADGTLTATFVRGDLPSAGAGPSVALSTNAAVIPGGTTPAALSADAPFTRVVLAIDGVDGYYAVDLPDGHTSAELIVTLSQELAALELPGFDWVIGVGSGDSIGAYTIMPVSVIAVGTGDVQISLSWNTAADVDLHVVDPAGEEIFYAHRDSASGGALDLDSNAACGSDGPRNENITWPVGGAPDGTYAILVDYWSACDQAATDFTVSVNAADQAPQVMSGNFTGGGDFGGEGAGIPITTLLVGSGVAAIAPAPRDLGTFAVDLAPGAVKHAK